tara:strand:- start:670 stop:1011 length:342 start_codon:yes stop_codon:yes gene_type:complete
MASEEDKELQIRVHTSGIDIPDKDFEDEYTLKINRSQLWSTDACKWINPREFIALVVQIIGNSTLVRLQQESRLFLYEGGLRPITSMGGIETGFFRSIHLSTYDIYAHVRHIG